VISLELFKCLLWTVVKALNCKKNIFTMIMAKEYRCDICLYFYYCLVFVFLVHKTHDAIGGRPGPQTGL
jgi:hypothetical protein